MHQVDQKGLIYLALRKVIERRGRQAWKIKKNKVANEKINFTRNQSDFQTS